MDKEKRDSFDNNREILDSLVLLLEVSLFSKRYGLSVTKYDLEEMLSLVKKLMFYNDDYRLLQEEVRILWARIGELEAIRKRYLKEQEKGG